MLGSNTQSPTFPQEEEETINALSMLTTLLNKETDNNVQECVNQDIFKSKERGDEGKSNTRTEESEIRD
jgi:hypothetical protein